MIDRRSQDAVDRALSELIVDLALQGDEGEEIQTIANALHIWREHWLAAKQPRKCTREAGLPTSEEGGDCHEHPAIRSTSEPEGRPVATAGTAHPDAADLLAIPTEMDQRVK